MQGRRACVNVESEQIMGTRKSLSRPWSITSSLILGGDSISYCQNEGNGPNVLLGLQFYKPLLSNYFMDNVL